MPHSSYSILAERYLGVGYCSARPTWICPRCDAVHSTAVNQCPCTTPEALSAVDGRVAIVGDVDA